MGGPGSGERWPKKGLVEDHYRLDVRELRRERGIQPGNWLIVNYEWRGERVAHRGKVGDGKRGSGHQVRFQRMNEPEAQVKVADNPRLRFGLVGISISQSRLDMKIWRMYQNSRAIEPKRARAAATCWLVL